MSAIPFRDHINQLSVLSEQRQRLVCVCVRAVVCECIIKLPLMYP